MFSGLKRFIRGELVRLKFVQMWHLVAGAVVTVAALFGGLDSVDAKPTVFKAGQPYNDGEFTVNIEKAIALDDVRAGDSVVMPAEPGLVYLGVVSTVRNDGPIAGALDKSVANGVELDLQKSHSNFLGAFRVADASVVPALGPKLSDKFVFLWKLPRNELEPGSTVTLRVWQKQLHEMIVIYGNGWLESQTSYAQIVLPVVKA